MMLAAAAAEEKTINRKRKNADTCRKKIHMTRRMPMWTRLCLVILLLGSSASAQTTFRYDEFTDETTIVELGVTEDTSFLQSSSEGIIEDASSQPSSSSDSELEDAGSSPSSEGTGNAIPELPETSPQDILKKHSTKKIEPPEKDKLSSKSHRQMGFNLLQSTSPRNTLNNSIQESNGPSLTNFIPLNSTNFKPIDVDTEIDATTETEIETQDETDSDFSTSNYSENDSPSMISVSSSTTTVISSKNLTSPVSGNSGNSSSSTVVTSTRNLPSSSPSTTTKVLSSTSTGNKRDSSSTVTTERNSPSVTHEYQVRKVSTLKKDFYSEGSAVPVGTMSVDKRSSNPPIQNTQNTQNIPKRTMSIENSTVSYKILTDKLENSPPMLTIVMTTTPASTLPMLPKIQTVIEETTTNPSDESSLGVNDVLSTKRELKTTTPEEEITTVINNIEKKPTTIATITGTAMSAATSTTSKLLTASESVRTTTNITVNIPVETSTRATTKTSSTETMTSKPPETSKATVNTPILTTRAAVSMSTGTIRTSINTRMATTTSTTSTTIASPASTVATTETTVPTTVPTTVMILTPISSVTAATINRFTTPSTKTTPSVITISKTQRSDITHQTEATTESVPVSSAIPPKITADNVKSLTQIVIKGTWDDICPKLSLLKQSLAELFKKNMNITVSTEQIQIYQSRCPYITTPTSLMLKDPLTSVLVYVVNNDHSLNETLTKALPDLWNKSPFEFTPEIQSVRCSEEPDSGSIVIIIVLAVIFIVVVLLAALVFIMKKRQSRFNYGERCRPVSLDAYSLDSVSAYNSIRRSKAALRASKRSYGNPSFEDSTTMPTHPLNFARLTTFCNESNAIVEEFGTIPQVSSNIDELPVGAELKNRYANVIPLPETRVYLQAINNDPTTEYINASYVRGPKNADKFYIACQAPTENTVTDFWRMIWEQQCKVIVMLTDLVENGVEKCTEYVPPLEVSDCHRLYGDYQVTLKKREAKDKYAISTLLLKNLEKNIYREVWHVWYLWPVKGVPSDPAGLVAVLQEARALQRGSTAPILVHCSPGTGRTGTVIAIDLCIRQFEITRSVDVPRTVYSIRRDRAGAVQTREQYGFIYKTISYYADKLTGGAIEST